MLLHINNIDLNASGSEISRLTHNLANIPANVQSLRKNPAPSSEGADKTEILPVYGL